MVSLWRHMASGIEVIIGSGNGLLSTENKPLSKRMLTNCQLKPREHTSKKFEPKCIFAPQNALETAVCKTLAFLFRTKCVLDGMTLAIPTFVHSIDQKITAQRLPGQNGPINKHPLLELNIQNDIVPVCYITPTAMDSCPFKIYWIILNLDVLSVWITWNMF